MMKEIKKKRILAAAIDFLIACLMIQIVEAIVDLFVGPFRPSVIFSGILAINFTMYWFICKDCYNGMSPGKRIMGIQVININTLHIADPLRCVVRGLCSCFGLIELIVFFSNSQGLRIGDYLASTRVVLRDRKLQQKHGPAIFTFIVFFVFWIVGFVIFYTRLKTSV